MFYIGKLVHI